MATNAAKYGTFHDPTNERLNRRHLIARLRHPGDVEKFLQDCGDGFDRDPNRYPDPYFRDIRPDDFDLLVQYRRRTAEAVAAFTPETPDEEAALRSFHEREQNRYNIHRGKYAFPEPEAVGVDPTFVERVENATFDTGYGISLSGRTINWSLYTTLMHETPLETLRYLAAYFRVYDQTPVRRDLSTTTRILNAIRYVRGDPTVSLDAVIDFTPFDEVADDMTLPNDEIERGVPFETVRNELRSFVTTHQTTLVALALANIDEVHNIYHPDLANGEYGAGIGTTNFAARMDGDDAPRNVFVHEFFHSIQDLLGALDCNAGNEPVAFDASPDEWEPVLLLQSDDDRVTEIQDEMLALWHQFRAGAFDPLCEYQTKNIHEFFAVAFEVYCEQPAMLRSEQPAVHDLLTRLLDTNALA